MDMRKNILFVCSGNTCRSAMAAYLAAAIKEGQFPDRPYRFDSAGIAAVDGYPASENSVIALKEWDIDMSGHRSKKFQSYMVDRSDVIACMTGMHKKIILDEYPEAANKVYALGELSGTQREIPDPYLGSLSLYRLTRDVLKEEILEMLKKFDDAAGNE
jgi:protein-tyrosine-phosphatase